MDKTDLIEQCKAGDRAAFGKLYTCYAPRMMRVIRRFIADRSTAEDILHDGFVVVFTHISEVKDTTKIEQWMGAIMRNLALQYLKQIDITTDLDEEEAVEDCPDPEALLTYEELQTIIERLPEGYKTIFRLSVLEGKSHKEIAAMLGIAPHTASSQLYHARVMLRRLISEHLATLSIFLLLLLPIGWLLYLHFREKPAETPTVAERKETMNIVSNPQENTHDSQENQDTKHDAPTPKCVMENTLRAEVRETKDEAKDLTVQTDTCQSRQASEISPKQKDLPSAPAYTPVRRKQRTQWSVSARFSTSGTSDNPSASDEWVMSDPVDGSHGTPIPPPAGTETKPDETSHHDVPLTFGLRVARPLTPRLSIETGIDFTRLHSHFGYHGGGVSLDQETKAYYLGIPVKLNCRFYDSPKWSIYGTIGTGIEIPVKSRLQSDDRSTRPHNYGARSFRAPWQAIVTGGAGVEYKLTPHIGLYVEPSVQHHFGGTSTLPTVWQDSPTVLTLPVGIRFSW